MFVCECLCMCVYLRKRLCVNMCVWRLVQGGMYIYIYMYLYIYILSENMYTNTHVHTLSYEHEQYFHTVTSHTHSLFQEKLLRLKLQEAQAREIVRVAFHCCIHEQGWNPFYAHLLGHLCSLDKRHQVCGVVQCVAVCCSVCCSVL